MFITGSGLGLLASQIGNINMSAVEGEDTAEAGGLQGTFQNLGSSIGTALVGSVFVASLLSGFTSSISSSQLSQSTKDKVYASTQNGIGIVSEQQVIQYALNSGVSESEATEVASHYTDAQVQGLKEALFFISIVGFISIFLSKDIPKTDPIQKK